MINSVCDTLGNDHSVQGNAHTRKGRVGCVWRFGCNYHPNSLKKTYTNPEGITYTYYYNKNNQFAALHIPGAGQVSHSNFEWLQPQTIVFLGGSQIQLSYEDFQRVEQRILKDPEQNDKASAFYDYDLVGDIESINTEHGLYSFGYDSLYRLTEADYDVQGSTSAVGAGSAGAAPLESSLNDESFGYDGVGNRTEHTVSSESGEAEQVALAYNEQNQLVSQTEDGETTSFIYNGNGHTATKTTLQETVEYGYNHEERLIAVKRDGSVVGKYAYDPLGRRIKKTAGGDTTWFMYTEEGLAAEYDASGNLLAEYQFTPYSTWMTDPLMQRRNGQVYYYQNDHLGTPQRMVSGGGQVVWEARYEAFGEAEIVMEAVENNLRFPGQYFDGETGLHHNYFRDYDVELGRYIQSDPIGLAGGLNIFIYTKNSPLIFVDPLGLDTKRCARELAIFGDEAMSPSLNPVRHDYLVVNDEVFSFQAGSNMFWSDGWVDDGEDTENQKCELISEDPAYDEAVIKAADEIGEPTYAVNAYPGTIQHLAGARNCQTWADDVLDLADETYENSSE